MGSLLLALGATAQEPALGERMDAFLRGYQSQNAFAGVARVERGGELLFQRAYPVADAARTSASAEASPGARFPIASTSKSFTAVLTMCLVEDGALSLADRIEDLLPGFTEAPVGPATVHQLLRHTAGLPEELEDVLPDAEGRPVTRGELRVALARAPLVAPVGTQHRYSNLGYVLLALLIEEVTGESYGQFLRQRIVEPAGLVDTLVLSGTGHGTPGPGLACEVDGSLRRAPELDLSFALGSGNLGSTAPDLARFIEALGAGQIVSAESWRAITTSGGAAFGDYGYGFRIPTYARPGGGRGRLVRHGGTIDGYQANVHRYVEDELTVVVLARLEPCPIMDLTTGLADLALGRDRAAPEATVFRLLEAVESGSHGRARELAERFRGAGTPLRSGGPEALIGAPDGASWTALHADRGRQWVEVELPSGTRASAARILQVGGPGAVVEVCRIGPHGERERVPVPADRDERDLVVAFPDEGPCAALRVVLDTERVRGRNELDAVGCVDLAGDSSWGTQALASTSLAMRIQPGPTSPLHLDVLLHVAYVLRVIGQPERAAPLAAFVAQVHGRSGQAHLEHAEARLALGELDAARSALQHATDLEPDDEQLAARLEALSHTGTDRSTK